LEKQRKKGNKSHVIIKIISQMIIVFIIATSSIVLYDMYINIEVENEGYLKSIQGKGTFVAPKNTELAKEQAQKDIEKYLEKIVTISKRFAIEENDVIEMFKIIYREEH